MENALYTQPIVAPYKPDFITGAGMFIKRNPVLWRLSELANMCFKCLTFKSPIHTACEDEVSFIKGAQLCVDEANTIKKYFRTAEMMIRTFGFVIVPAVILLGTVNLLPLVPNPQIQAAIILGIVASLLTGVARGLSCFMAAHKAPSNAPGIPVKNRLFLGLTRAPGIRQRNAEQWLAVDKSEAAINEVIREISENPKADRKNLQAILNGLTPEEYFANGSYNLFTRLMASPLKGMIPAKLFDVITEDTLRSTLGRLAHKDLFDASFNDLPLEIRRRFKVETYTETFFFSRAFKATDFVEAFVSNVFKPEIWMGRAAEFNKLFNAFKAQLKKLELDEDNLVLDNGQKIDLRQLHTTLMITISRAPQPQKILSL